jgi:predicted lipase
MTNGETPPNPYGDNYIWPQDLYTEMVDMVALSFMAYTFAYIVDVSRTLKKKGEDGLVGLTIDEHGDRISKTGENESSLMRSFTPLEVKKIVEDNQEVLAKYYKTFKSNTHLLKTLALMIERASQLEIPRPLTLEEFDDEYQKRELVYAVTKDSVNKRITIVFRGTENELAFATNWSANLTFRKEHPPVPEALKGKIKHDRLDIHGGFYDYLFKNTIDETDPEQTTKFDQIMSKVKPMLQKYPDYKLFLTGHSLGGALSTIAALFMSCDPDMPKPVTCINFGSPRCVGDAGFDAIQYQEMNKQMRMLRSVNENDLVTAVPSIGYHHVGFQVTTYRKSFFGRLPRPEIYYPSPKRTIFGKIAIAWGNSLITGFNIRYDHGEYRQRIAQSKEYLQTKNLNAMYLDSNLVGFTL